MMKKQLLLTLLLCHMAGSVCVGADVVSVPPVSTSELPPSVGLGTLWFFGTPVSSGAVAYGVREKQASIALKGAVAWLCCLAVDRRFNQENGIGVFAFLTCMGACVGAFGNSGS